MKKRLKDRQNRGFAVVLVLVFVTLTTLLAVTYSSTVSWYIRRSRTDVLQERGRQAAHSTLNAGLAWFRENSKDISRLFASENFYQLFRRRSDPAQAPNQGELFRMHTVLRHEESDNAVFFTNSPLFGRTATSDDPDLKILGKSFEEKFRDALPISLSFIDATPLQPAKDYGPLREPETSFTPLVRIESLGGSEGGAHLVSFLQLKRVGGSKSSGFFGEKELVISSECDGFTSGRNGNPISAPRLVACDLTSRGTVTVESLATVYGSVSATESVVITGDVCADTSCKKVGEVCQGSTCEVPTMPTFEQWDALCPQDQGELSIRNGSPLELTIQGDLPINRCWDEIRFLGNGMRRLRLSSTKHPYFIRHIDFGNRANRQIEVVPDSSNGRVTLYVERLSGLTGNQEVFRNTTRSPTRFFLNYLGSQALAFRQNEVYMRLIAPHALVIKEPRTTFFGSIWADRLHLQGRSEGRNRPARADITLGEALSVGTSEDLVADIIDIGEIHQDLWQ